jgi:hypothetical protein
MVIALAISGLAVLVSSIMSQMNRSQKEARLRGVALDLETRYRAALQSTRALANTRGHASNATLNSCFSAACTLNVSRTLALVDASGQLLIPLSQPTSVNDAGATCTPSATDPSCQWSTIASYTARGSGSTASSFDVVVTLSHQAPPGSDFIFNMRPRQISASLAREMFIAPSSSSDCSTNQVMYGINIDGTPKCRTAITNLSCPSNQALVGFNAAGAAICRTPVPYLAGCYWNNNGSDHCICPGGYVMVGHDLYGPGPGGMAYGAQCVCCAVGVSL